MIHNVTHTTGYWLKVRVLASRICALFMINVPMYTSRYTFNTHGLCALVTTTRNTWRRRHVTRDTCSTAPPPLIALRSSTVQCALCRGIAHHVPASQPSSTALSVRPPSPPRRQRRRRSLVPSAPPRCQQQSLIISCGSHCSLESPTGRGEAHYIWYQYRHCYTGGTLVKMLATAATGAAAVDGSGITNRWHHQPCSTAPQHH